MSPGTYCKVIVSSDSADTEWRYTVNAIKCNNRKAENVNPDAFNDKDYDFDGHSKGLNAGQKSNRRHSWCRCDCFYYLHCCEKG